MQRPWRDGEAPGEHFKRSREVSNGAFGVQNWSPSRLQHRLRSIPGHVSTATFPWGRRQWAQPSRMCTLGRSRGCHPYAPARTNAPPGRTGGGWQARPREITLHSFTCNIALVLVLEKEVGTSWHWKRACLPGGADATWRLPAGFQPHSTPALPSALEHQQCIRSPLAGGEYTSSHFLLEASLRPSSRM